MLFALRDALPPEALTAGLVAYRAIYHLVPLAIAIVILAIREAREGLPQLAGAAHYVGSRGVKLVPTVLACHDVCERRSVTLVHCDGGGA